MTYKLYTCIFHANILYILKKNLRKHNYVLTTFSEQYALIVN